MKSTDIVSDIVEGLENDTISSESATVLADVSLEYDAKGIDLSQLGANSPSMSPKDFQLSINSGMMLVKSVKGSEVKILNIEPKRVLRPISAEMLEVRDKRVQPKYNFSKADPDVVNIFAHKGPDEPSGTTGWGQR